MSSIKSILRQDAAEAKKMHMPWWGIVVIIIGTVIFGLFFEDWDTRTVILPLLNSFAVVGFVMRVKWKMRKRPWFWIATAVMVAFHVAMFQFFPWTSKWVPSVAIIAIVSLDYCIMIGVFAAAQLAWESHKPRKS